MESSAPAGWHTLGHLYKISWNPSVGWRLAGGQLGWALEARLDGDSWPCLSAGAVSNPEVFSYAVEVYEAYKQRSLSSDIIEEQKKVQEADLVIFQVGSPSV